jgi:hypothetical protein
MMGMIKPPQPALSRSDFIASAWLLGSLLVAFFIVLLVLTTALVNHRAEIDDLTRRLEALEKRK